MKDKKAATLSEFYHCYSKAISVILNIPEIDIICSKKLLSLQINYETMSLAGTLFSITEDYVEMYCKTSYFYDESILKNIKNMSDGLYCLLTKTDNLTYCKSFIAHTGMLHYITLEKINLKFFAIDFFYGVKYYQELNLDDLDFTDSVLTVFEKNSKEKEKVTTEEIISYYCSEKKKDNKFDAYRTKFLGENITIDTAINFIISGVFSSRIALVHLMVSEGKMGLNDCFDILYEINNVSEKIKLLLVKLQFYDNSRDRMKLIDSICSFEKLEEKIFQISFNQKTINLI